MQEEKPDSSFHIVLFIGVAILASVGLGWFLLGTESDSGFEVLNPEVSAPALAAVPSVAPELELESPTITVESDLRKARLAAEADILAVPFEQSAVHFYGKVLEVEPEHEVANAELDAVLGRLAITVSEHLAAEEYRRAHSLAQLVSAVRPDHALVHEVQQALDQVAGDLVTQAMKQAEEGDAEAAETILAQAASLPGRNRQYFQAVQESIDDLLQAQRDAEAKREESNRLAAARELSAWMEKVRAAIADGKLIAPAGDNALEFLGERQAADEISSQLEQELFTSITAAATLDIGAGNLDSAEKLLRAADRMGTDDDEVATLRASLEQAFLDRETARVVPMSEFVRVKTVPARYPRRAEERGISGWVEVRFTITPTGETADVTVAQAEPEKIFDDPAIEAVEQWEFEPREFRGQLIAQRASARLVFRLE